MGRLRILPRHPHVDKMLYIPPTFQHVVESVGLTMENLPPHPTPIPKDWVFGGL